MIYKGYYRTPDGFSDMIMTGDGEYLTGLWFETTEKEYEKTAGVETDTKGFAKTDGVETDVFSEVRHYLDVYFSGEEPKFIPKYRMDNLTPFRKDVIELINTAAYGKTITYGAIANELAKRRGIPKMSAQAVGKAVGWNPICIIVPCHRIIGTDGSMTGYGGGLSNKIALLTLERRAKE